MRRNFRDFFARIHRIARSQQAADLATLPRAPLPFSNKLRAMREPVDRHFGTGYLSLNYLGRFPLYTNSQATLNNFLIKTRRFLSTFIVVRRN
ncbi:MAG: hypothetical protein AB1810_09870 [Pseudomonadota bacterium]